MSTPKTTVIALGVLLLNACLPLSAPAQLLYPNDPDPFCPNGGPETAIQFELFTDRYVDLTIRGPFDEVQRWLFSGWLGAGLHMLAWDGRNSAGELLTTGLFNIVLVCGNERDEDDCTVFCGNDLAGPYRRGIGGHDLGIAFYVGLESPQEIELQIRNSAGTSLVRELFSGPCTSGVSTFVWDLTNTFGNRVVAGSYQCRLSSAAYNEQFTFTVSPITPALVIVSMTDVHGNSVTSSQNPAQPAVLETPIQAGLFRFNRRLSEAEWQTLLEDDGTAGGAFRHIGPTFVRISPDSTSMHLEGFQMDDRTWPDVYGPAQLDFDPLWISPSSHCFHLRHSFEGITATNEVCDLIGNFDPTDWACFGVDEADAVGGSDVAGVDPPPPPTTFSLAPACPNPEPPGGSTRIRFTMPQSVRATIRVVDTGGYSVRTLADGILPAGVHEIVWDLRTGGGDDVPAGIYHVIAEFGDDYPLICGGDVAVSDVSVSVFDPPTRSGSGLGASWPNPFNPRTTISYDLVEPGAVSLNIYDAAGRIVRRLRRGEREAAGRHETVWDGRDESGRQLPTGVYFCRFNAGATIETAKLVLLK